MESLALKLLSEFWSTLDAVALSISSVASALERYRWLTLISSIDWFSLASLKEPELLVLSSLHAVDAISAARVSEKAKAINFRALIMFLHFS